MFFKNLTLYRLATPLTVGVDALTSQFNALSFHHCGDIETKAYGWVPPVKNRESVHAVNGQYLVALKMEEKILPAKVINRFLNERIAKLEEERGHPVGRKEKRDLKELIIQELRPRAFSVDRITHAWIDPVNGWLAIDTSSSGRAEELLEFLLKTLVETPLRITVPATQISAMNAMNGWVAGDPPTGFTVDQDLELISPEKATVRYTRHTLEDDEVKGHLAKGKVATKLALTWNDKISFILTDKLQIKRLSFLDLLKEQSEAAGVENKDEQFDADFALMCGELSLLIVDLMSALGGVTDKE